ncbi:hypothetical protein [Novipirellula maiorica]|nr:hypothetical protein [Rhodopirellula maiorica]
MNSFDQEAFDTEIKLRYRERKRRRYFVTTVAMMLAVWWATHAVAATLNSSFFYSVASSNSLTYLLATGLTAIFTSLTSVVALQIAVWWQWPVPQRSPWKGFTILVFSYAVLNLYPYLQNEMWEMFGTRWWSIVAITLAFHLIVIPLYVLGMRIPGRLLQFHLFDAMDDPLPSESSSPPNQRWSIAGFVVLTLLVALLMALYQGMRKLFETQLGDGVMTYYPPNDLVMMIYLVVDITASLLLLWAAALSGLSRHRWAIALLVLSVMSSWFAEAAYMSIVADGLSVMQVRWFDLFIRHAFGGVTVYLVSRWCFRRWRIAGYQLRGWVQRRELTPP